MDTLEAIATIMSRINFETNEFRVPSDTLDRMKIQMAVAHLQSDSARTRLFEEMIMEKKKDFFTTNTIIDEKDFGGSNEATRESEGTRIEDSGTNEVSAEYGSRNQITESNT